MGSDWKEYSLGELIKLQGGFAFKSKDFSEEGVPVAKIKNVRHGYVDLSDSAKVIPEYVPKAENYFIKHGDILISMTGSGPQQPNSIVGRVARHDGFDDEFLINQRVGRFLIKDQERIDQRFLYYFLSRNEIQWHLVSIATGSANQVNISGNQIESIKAKFPPLPEQKAIAHILGSLDDKIELNRQQNETLEQMAQALFESWFVHFDPVIDNALAAGHAIPEPYQLHAQNRQALGDRRKPLPDQIQQAFPSRFTYTDELGWMPEGWKIQKLDEISDKISKGTTPRKSDVIGLQENVPFLKVRDISDDGKININSLDLIPEEVSSKQLKRSILRTADILFTIAGTIGRVTILPHELDQSNCNQAIAFIRLKDQERHLELIDQHMKSERIQNEVEMSIVQAVQANVSLGTLGKLKVIIPDDGVLENWLDKITPTYKRTLEINKEMQILSSLRDTLLPQLISGKLRVPEAEKIASDLL